MRRLRHAASCIAVLSVISVFAPTGKAHAQATVSAITVTSCGSQSYTTGLAWPIVQDITGHLCTNASGGGGGGGPVTMASGAVASGAYSSGSIASGAFASGAYAAGSISAGAMADFGTGSTPAANTLLWDLTNSSAPLIAAINGPIPGCTIGTSCAFTGANAPSQTLTNTAYVSVGTSATQVLAARTGAYGTGRAMAIIVNTSTTAASCGPSNAVTTSTGLYLAGVAGASITLPYQGAIYCISTSGTISISAGELY